MIIKAESSVITIASLVFVLRELGLGYAVKLGTFVTENFCNEGARKIIHENVLSSNLTTINVIYNILYFYHNSKPGRFPEHF